MWNSQIRDKHLNQKALPIRETLEVGMPNIINDIIVSSEKIIFADAEYLQHILSIDSALPFNKVCFDG